MGLKKALSFRVLATMGAAPVDRRLSSYLEEFRVLRCFTGYGYKSSVHLNKKVESEPNMSVCKEELDSSVFSLAHLMDE